MKPELSIVVPVRNRAAIVGRTLDAIEAQTLRPLKVVLVDNDSTDDTVAVLERWKEHAAADDFEVVLLSEHVAGAAAARNTGLAAVDTPWVMFFDSDDTMTPDHCAKAMDDARRSGADIVGWDAEMRFANGRKRGVFADRHLHFNNLFHGTFATQRWCARTDMVRRAGGWNPDALLWDDIELGARMIELGAKVHYRRHTPVTVTVNDTPGSITNQPDDILLSRIPDTLSMMSATLPEHLSHYVAFKGALAAGEVRRKSDNADTRRRARTLYEKSREMLHKQWQRVLLYLAYQYIGHFSRGSVAMITAFIR